MLSGRGLPEWPFKFSKFHQVKILSLSNLIFTCKGRLSSTRLPASNALACSEPSSTRLTPHMSELAPLDPDLLADVLSKHPFVTIDGVCNVRDLGMVPVAGGEHVTRSGFMYRSGELSGVTQHGVFHIFFGAFFLIPDQARGSCGPSVLPQYSTCDQTQKLRSTMLQRPKLRE